MQSRSLPPKRTRFTNLITATFCAAALASCGQETSVPEEPAAAYAVQPAPEPVLLTGVEFSYGETQQLISALDDYDFDDDNSGGGGGGGSGGSASGGGGGGGGGSSAENRGRSAFYLSTGGVALSGTANGADGWSIENITYDSASLDGQRLILTLSQNGGSPVNVRADAWDWEIIPIARFAASNEDGAFTYFGTYPDGSRQSPSGFQAIGYHPALRDSLVGLRLMQLDLMAFIPQFSGYFTDANGAVILGGGEAQALGADASDANAIAGLASNNRSRIDAANAWFASWCASYPSAVCAQSQQPHQSYVVGDIITSTSFDGSGNMYGDVCWDFWRATEGGETPSAGFDACFEDGSGILRLESMSYAFCGYVTRDLQGMHPLVYRSAGRIMHLAALFRRFRQNNRSGFESFRSSLDGAIVVPAVLTPTEMRLL